ncbi:transporter substrate-binding domain-containing protein [Pseudodesulfovibrio sp.]|nr:transporter substrate-binding domain-containing protein [Pseudodesulfovibrio sp.]
MKYLLCFLLTILVPMPALAQELHIATSAYCPLVCLPVVDGKEGIMHDVLRESFKDSEYKLIFENIPYGRAIQETLDGKYAGVTFAGVANAPDFIFVRNMILTNAVHFATLKTSQWKYDGVDSLKGIRFGIPTGFRTGNNELDNYLDKHAKDSTRIMRASNDNPTAAQQENIDRLLAGRIDAMLVGSLAFSFISKEMGVADTIQLDPTPVALFHNHLAFSPKYPAANDLRKQTEKTIDAMQHSGKLNKIMKRYGLNQ